MGTVREKGYRHKRKTTEQYYVRRVLIEDYRRCTTYRNWLACDLRPAWQPVARRYGWNLGDPLHTLLVANLRDPSDEELS